MWTVDCEVIYLYLFIFIFILYGTLLSRNQVLGKIFFFHFFFWVNFILLSGL